MVRHRDAPVDRAALPHPHHLGRDRGRHPHRALGIETDAVAHPRQVADGLPAAPVESQQPAVDHRHGQQRAVGHPAQPGGLRVERGDGVEPSRLVQRHHPVAVHVGEPQSAVAPAGALGEVQPSGQDPGGGHRVGIQVASGAYAVIAFTACGVPGPRSFWKTMLFWFTRKVMIPLAPYSAGHATSAWPPVILPSAR